MEKEKIQSLLSPTSVSLLAGFAKIDPNEKRKRMEENGEKREDGSEIGRK